MFRQSRLTMVLGAMCLSIAAARPANAIDQVTIMAPAAPGGGWDMTARALQDAFQSTGIIKSVQVENVPGAGGTRGLVQFAKRKGDPKALMVSGLVMVGAIIANRTPASLNDVTPIARLTSEWQAIAVTPESRIKTMQDLVGALRADPGAVSWGGGSAGGTDHITGALVMKAAGVDPAKINYVAHSGGGESLAAILGNHVTLGVNSISEFDPQVRAGKLKIIAVSSDKRIDGVDAPTFKETGLDVVIGNWRGIFAASGISEADKAAIVESVDKLVKSDAWRMKLANAAGRTATSRGQPSRPSWLRSSPALPRSSSRWASAIPARRPIRRAPQRMDRPTSFSLT